MFIVQFKENGEWWDTSSHTQKQDANRQLDWLSATYELLQIVEKDSMDKVKKDEHGI